MQSFLPYPDFAQSAKALDMKRLGKMRVETLQILNTILNNKKGWANHPAVSMWRTYENHLVDYGLAICEEWIGRGYKDTCFDKIKKWQNLAPNGFKGMPPPWLGDERLHSSHKSALLFKNPQFYQQYKWPEVAKLDYFWPTKELTNKSNSHNIKT
jgi:hypothetical protein